MGRRGPAPKPRALRVLHGDKPSRINQAEPLPRQMVPAAPGWLSGDLLAMAEWKEAVTELTVMRVLTSADGRMLALYCQALANAARASADVVEHGVLIEGYRGGMVKNPAVGLQREAASFAARLALQFGLTPASRTSLHAEPVEGRSPLESLLS